MRNKRQSSRAVPLHQLLWNTVPWEVQEELIFREVRDSWGELFPDFLGTSCRPLKMRESTLFIQASRPAIAQEVQFQAKAILGTINRNFSLHLSRIRVSVGAFPPSKESPKKENPLGPPVQRIAVSSQEVRKAEDLFELSQGQEELKHLLGELRAVYRKRFQR